MAATCQLEGVRRVAVEATAALVEAQTEATRSRMKACEKAYEFKLQTNRRAAQSQLSNQAAQMEGAFSKRLEDKISALCANGDGLVQGLGQRIEELGEELRAEKLRSGGIEEALQIATAELRANQETRVDLSVQAKSAEAALVRSKDAEAQLSARVEEGRAMAARLQEMLRTQESASGALREERDALQRSCDELGKRATTIEAAQAEAETALARQREEAEAARHAADASVSNFKEMIERLREEPVRLREELKRLRADAEAQMVRDTQQVDAPSTTVESDTSGTSEIERLKGELTVAQESVKATTQEAAMLKASLSAMGKAQQELKEQLGAGSSASEQAMAAVTVAENKVKALETQVVGAELALRSARADSRKVRGEVEALSETLEKERQVSAQAQVELLRQSESERAKAVESVERTAQARLDKIQTAVDEATSRLASSKQRAMELEKEATANRRAADTARARAEALTVDFSASVKKVDSLECEVAGLTDQVAALSSADGNYANLMIKHSKAIGSLEAHKKASARLKAELSALQLHHAEQTALLEGRRDAVATALDRTNKALRATSTALEQINAASKAERAALVDAALSSLRQLRAHLSQAVRSNRHDGADVPRDLNNARDGEDAANGVLEVRSLMHELEAAARHLPAATHLPPTATHSMPREAALADAGADGRLAPPAKRSSPVKAYTTPMATWRPELGIPWPSWWPSVNDAAVGSPSALSSRSHAPHPPSSTSPMTAMGGRARVHLRDARNGVPAGPSAMFGICVTDQMDAAADELPLPPRAANLSLDPAISSIAQAGDQIRDHDGTWVPPSDKPTAVRTEVSAAAAEAAALANRRRRDAAHANTQAEQAQARAEVDDARSLPYLNHAWRGVAGHGATGAGGGGAMRVSLSGVEYSGVRARPRCCAS